MSLEELRIKRIGESLLPYLGNCSELLDIGCGNARLGIYLTEKLDIKYHGVDIVEQKLADNHILFTKSDLPYPFADKSFDVVLLILTLHHFEVPEAGFAEAIRLAKKKILLLEDVPRNQLEMLCMKIVDFTGNRLVSKDIPLPYNFYNDKKWKEIFKNNNLKLNDRSNVFPLPFPRLNHYLYEVLL
mgnify:CR=1 FL=1